MTQQTHKCEHCGAKIKEYKHNLSKGIVVSLMKMAKSVRDNDRNDIHISTECEFTKQEYNNFQKLRYFALVAKIKKEDGSHSGRWLITRRGWRFLQAREAVYQNIVTYRNHIVERSDEKVMIYEVMNGKEQYFQTEFNYSIHDYEQ